MHYRKLIVNISKYIQARRKLNYITTHVCPLCTWNAAFKNHLPQITVTNGHYYNNGQNSRKRYATNFVASAGLFFGLLDFFKSDEEKIPELIMTIKRSILLIQMGEYQKAEKMLHVALREAQTLQHYNAITYIYDVMANLAFDTGDYKKAEILFVSVLQRLLSAGTPQDDLRVIHISAKMAKVFEETREMEKAENGYRFCLEKLQNHLDNDSEDEDVLGLLSITSNWYGQMLFSQAKYTESLKYYSQAYELYLKTHEANDEQVVILLNDIGTIHYMIGQYDTAIEYLSMAERIGSKLPEPLELGSVHINMGNAFIKKGLYDEARKHCVKGWKLARSTNDDESLKEAETCLSEIKNVIT